jgi:hypothetical protein
MRIISKNYMLCSRNAVFLTKMIDAKWLTNENP